jgi:serine/threonine protein phosphatase 1
MRTFVISDIHGNNELFRRSLKAIGLKKSDRLILLGDLIDRGQDSKGVLDTIFLLRDNGFNVECLFGNHEQMLLDATLSSPMFSQWIVNGGDKTLSSFLTRSLDKIPLRYFDLIRTFKYYIQEDDFIFVHAALNMKIDDPYSDIQTLLWERDAYKFYDISWIGNRTLIHGHDPQTKEDIISAINGPNKIICIDNGTFLKRPEYGSLCVLQIENLHVKFFT